MSTTSVTVTIHLRDDGPGPQVAALPGGEPLVAVQFPPTGASILVPSAAQADRLIAALTVARELLGGASGLTPEPPAELEAEECGHSDDPAYTCDALSGHGGNHTAHGPGGIVYHVWSRGGAS